MSAPRALRIYAGPVARAHIQRHGLRPQDVAVIPAAAGGPKGLILGPLDRFIFGQWLPQSTQPLHLVGASIGAWRMATACLSDAVSAFERLEHDYIRQHYGLPTGQKRPTARQVSDTFGRNLEAFYGGRVDEVLKHPRYRLHILTSRGRHVLRREHGLLTPLGYLGAYATNAVQRRALGAWLERVVFSTSPQALPFATQDFRTRALPLTAQNFMPALQASCSIPFVLQAVHDIPGAPSGAYWDGGITDYHLHLDYRAAPAQCGAGLVLYPHFQNKVVPGWLDKALKWRHTATPFLERAIVLAPDPDWVRTLPNAKLPDRTDFTHYGQNLAARVQAWGTAVAAARQLAEEFAQWVGRGDGGVVETL